MDSFSLDCPCCTEWIGVTAGDGEAGCTCGTTIQIGWDEDYVPMVPYIQSFVTEDGRRG